MLNNDVILPSHPKEFEKLIGRKCGFIINVRNYNISHQVDQYAISMLTEDKKIIEYSNEENCFSDVDEEDCVELNREDDDVCEIEDPCSSTSRKRQRLSEENTDNSNEKNKLLIPKVEKI
ncbi:hypothetical protein M8C21_008704 [Ambrosia artemisiifolia]|uniref:Uncharacterized protein n=1 Tax=Ambrosia artemisiifolia TaxID=4212 RepID=A0AAD5D1U5_AMBAR|nr:hypothetical protein M8C21_008704 [Ambrosia artemisiifolia]